MATHVADTATSMLQTLTPIKNFSTHLNGIHGYAEDPTRQLVVDHFCGHATEDFRQCLIYDTHDSRTARLIGVEYIISRPMFEQLPDAEKKYWHSHAHEVKSGILVMPGVPNVVADREMKALGNTYGKTWHLWQVDRGDPLPYGEPKLMCSITRDELLNRSLLQQRDARFNINTDKIRNHRVEIEVPPPHPLADQCSRK